MERLSILKVIKDRLYNYQYLLKEFDYSVFVETIANEIADEIEEDEDI